MVSSIFRRVPVGPRYLFKLCKLCVSGAARGASTELGLLAELAAKVLRHKEQMPSGLICNLKGAAPGRKPVWKPWGKFVGFVGFIADLDVSKVGL